ncbi:hypothetical protein Tco_1018231 [Tanacetum coccineum]|uniref:Uncharacterized protein n=1 Tax=Tanacetum coccineum TaxID=301880 RepID=A0ABQ5FTR5_9ASTR
MFCNILCFTFHLRIMSFKGEIIPCSDFHSCTSQKPLRFKVTKAFDYLPTETSIGIHGQGWRLGSGREDDQSRSKDFITAIEKRATDQKDLSSLEKLGELYQKTDHAFYLIGVIRLVRLGTIPNDPAITSRGTLQGTIPLGSSHEVSVSTEGVEELKRIVKIKGVKKEALHSTRQKQVNTYAARITKMIADIEDRHHGPKHPSEFETMVFHNEDGILLEPTSNMLSRPHKGVKASANSDDTYSFTSAQDGDPLQDDVRLCLGNDLKKAQDHSQRQAGDLP